MIEISKTGMCEGCPRAELELLDFQTFDGQHVFELRCNHQIVCEHYEKEKNRKDIVPPFTWEEIK